MVLDHLVNNSCKFQALQHFIFNVSWNIVRLIEYAVATIIPQWLCRNGWLWKIQELLLPIINNTAYFTLIVLGFYVA